MVSISYVSSFQYNVTGQSIQSIDVVEDWKLRHHLACVVKYIARANHTNPILEDLHKAAWHLDRAYPKERDCCPEEFNFQHVNLESVTCPPEVVCADWQLSELLCSSLINIFLSQGCLSSLLRVKILKAAQGYLREEIAFLGQKEDLRLPLKRVLQIN